MNSDHQEQIRQRAEDLAAHLEITVEEARQRIWAALEAESPPLSQIYIGAYIPLWKRLIPGWRRRAQRRIIEAVEEEFGR